MDYFTDIFRLRKFHGITRCNAPKVAAYLSYWILKRKPIYVNESVLESGDSKRKRAIYINETFALNILFSYSFDIEKNLLADAEVLRRWRELTENLIYTFKYRNINPGHLEMIIIALYSDPIYQRLNTGE
ncbi:MAG: hypothetical protein A2Y33_11940 [Spirochaetes bacterium GWF1_51_8]|nr:MAG: hypothetical protein A2Y33_11940 [Spirochaetes bacterium GWF1_51_8]